MTRGPRKKIAKGIYQDAYGLGAVVTVQGRQRELRFGFDKPIREIRDEMEQARKELRDTAIAAPAKDTLAADAERYKKQIKHLGSWKEAWCEVKAWTARYGHLHRDEITAADVRVVMGEWREAGTAPKTINNRVNRLARLYRVLDGKKAPTPCDDVERLTPGKRPVVRVPDETLRAVVENLKAREQKGYLRSSKTRARFLVLVACGRRPCEIMRTQPNDVDLKARVWTPRDAKGGYSPGCYLNNDMLAAWTLFVKANAWGPYETSAFARTIRSAGWPPDVAPYQARHTFGLALSESGVDLSDIQVMMGHKHITTTRRHYVPVLGSRLQAAAQILEGRLSGPKKKAG